MEAWLILGILSYLSYAVSSTIDKYLMNEGGKALQTNTVKSFLDGVILLVLGVLFLEVTFSIELLKYSLILGGLYGLSGVFYFKLLQEMDAEKAVPAKQSSNIMLIFLLSAGLLNESVNIFNLLGVLTIVSGIYLLLTKRLELPELDKGLKILLGSLVLSVSYSLLTKVFLSDISPVTLGTAMYFSATLFLLAYNLYRGELNDLKTLTGSERMPYLGVAAVFGALGTFLLYSALEIGNASKIYPIAGAQSVFIFIFATLFLGEEFNSRKLFGTLTVFAGIFLTSI